MRMIERWFPCAEVSEMSASGWGSGKSEKNLFTWFAARPLAQAKAAVVTSLLPWPDDEIEQLGLQDLVRRAMMGKDAANAELKAEIEKAHPGGASMLDFFAGRAMIPLEAARLGVRADGGRNRFTAGLSRSASFRLPIAHMDGRYFIDDEGRKRLEGDGQVVFRYADDNPNGSLTAIAGVVNGAGNVLGLMPHPERNSEALLGNLDGRTVFEALLGS